MSPSSSASQNTSDIAGQPRIGVLGLGHMGSPMAVHLAEAYGKRTIVHSRTADQAKPACDAGALWAETPQALGAQSDVLISMVPDLPQLREVLDQVLDGAAGHRLILVISSTSSPVGVRELSQELAEGPHEVVVVDAPVSGGEDGAIAGSLSIMVGGEPADAEVVVELLRPCGTPVHLGPLGAGQVAKACNQLIVSATVTAIAEAAVLADRSGLDVSQLFTLLAGGYAGSRILQTRGERIATGDYSPSGPAKYMAKDLDFATDIAQATETKTILLPQLLQAFHGLNDQGLGEQDLAVIRGYLESL